MSTPNGAVYKIVIMGRARNQLQNLYQRANAQGAGSRVVAAVKQIVAWLRTNPLQFGEPRFSLHHANMEVRVGGVPPMLVVYGVHRPRHIVFIRDFLPAGPNF